MCDCVDLINKQFLEQGINTRIKTPIFMNLKSLKMGVIQAVIATEKRENDRREKPKMLVASYCPFCGEKYKDEEEL